MEPWELRPKKFQTSVAVPPAPVQVPSQRPLAPSVMSVTSFTNDKDDNGLWPKDFKLRSVVVPPDPVRVPSQRPLAPSLTSVMSVANDKGDNEMILGTVDRSSGVWLTAEENLG